MSLKDRAKRSLKKNWERAAVIFFASYIFSMVVIPAIVTIHQVFPNISPGLIWWSIQSVWDRWQTFNSAVIALIASLIAFKATTYHSHQEIENNFRAAKSRLPQALSDICSYAKECALIHHQYYVSAVGEQDRVQINSPERPLEAVEAIVECIRYSPIEVGNYLAKILESLQVIHARLRPDAPGTIHVAIAANEISYIKYIALTYKRTEHLFGYARNEENFTLPDESIDAINRIIRFQLGLFDLNINEAD